MSSPQRKALAGTGRGPVGKTAVVGTRDRATNQLATKVLRSIDKQTLLEFVEGHADAEATVDPDDAKGYESLPFDHDSVKHPLMEYVKSDVHTNGIKSMWSMLKRTHKGTFHKFSPKHLDRYVKEFAGRHSVRELGTLAQMRDAVACLGGRNLPYRNLIADNGLSSGPGS